VRLPRKEPKNKHPNPKTAKETTGEKKVTETAKTQDQRGDGPKGVTVVRKRDEGKTEAGGWEEKDCLDGQRIQRKENKRRSAEWPSVGTSDHSHGRGLGENPRAEKKGR